ncbi:multiubiquitin domain-containing protein [Asticcacaulis machinosus]|uniref:Multiubiquitin domain-containing protein n=1 Tax=Asticcacaulis machinosus TaxID=2984211 RepID=A0ABT5HHW3_9CAUL|nr:multiubiquitin domain-containing protein [Asticcacaulis machinosus]MDC7675189.1 multiubiquitin domain-containing protein [Asticcacaulis machinosus]
MSVPPPNEGVNGHPGRRVYVFETGNENFDFQRHETDDEKVVGVQICAAAGKHPVEDYAVLQQLPSGEIESIRPTESVTLSIGQVTRFFVIEGFSNRRFTIDGLSFEWPKSALAVCHAKTLAGAHPEDVLVLDRDDGDIVLHDHDFVDLDSDGVERLKLRKRPKLVDVIYNEAVFQLERRDYTVAELMASFGVKPGYVLELIKPDGEFKELKPNQIVNVHEGLVFVSHAYCGHSS